MSDQPPQSNPRSDPVAVVLKCIRALSPADRQRLIRVLERRDWFEGWIILETRLLNLITAAYQGAIRRLTKYSRRCECIRPKPRTVQQDERLRQRHDEGGKSYEEIAREEKMDYEEVRNAVRRARGRRP